MIKVAVSTVAMSALVLSACSPKTDAPTPSKQAAAPPPAAAPIGGPSSGAGAEAFLREALAMYASPAAYAAYDARRTAISQTAAQQDAQAAAEHARMYTPRLNGLLQSAKAPNGEIGLLDVAPLCMCQDDAGLIIRSIVMNPQADGKVQGTVTFTTTPGVLRYTLKRTSAGWRIGNIVGSGRPGEKIDVDLVRMLSAPT